jgi:cytochrome c peroxidase
MLRNIAKTAPYFHDGSVDRLDRAVRIMASVQLGRALDDATTASIVAFLESLTGEVPAHYSPPPAR